jgi:DNA-binding GntR family transcriptional regulator
MAFDTSDERLPYQQVAHALREEIRSGRLQPGDRMPTVAALCEKFSVAKMTVERAISELREEGLIVSWQGRGTFVRDPIDRDGRSPAITETGDHQTHSMIVSQLDLVVEKLDSLESRIAALERKSPKK